MRKIDVRLPMSAVIAAASHRVAARELLAPDQVAACSVTEQFSGTWKLVSWKIEQANGEVIDPPLGPDPLRWIIYQPGGRMFVELISEDADTPNALGLLSTCAERHRRRRAAEQRDALAAPHSITSSA